MESKNELRIIAKAIRKELDIDIISEKILSSFLASDLFKKSKNVAVYYPFGNELKIQKIFECTDKKFSLPKISENNTMEFYLYKNRDDLILNKYGIFEPNDAAEICQNIDLIILPALMADKLGYRLGYGGGYYDRYLRNKNIKKVILIPDELLTEELPIEKYDVKADAVITQTKVILV